MSRVEKRGRKFLLSRVIGLVQDYYRRKMKVGVFRFFIGLAFGFMAAVLVKAFGSDSMYEKLLIAGIGFAIPLATFVAIFILEFLFWILVCVCAGVVSLRDYIYMVPRAKNRYISPKLERRT